MSGAVGAGGEGGAGNPSPEVTPSEGAAPAPTQETPASTPEGAAPAEKAGEATEAKVPEPEEPKSFPWAQYRRVENELKKTKASRDELAQKYQTEQAQWQTEREQLAQKAQDYEVLRQAVEHDPEFAAEMENRIQGRRTAPTVAGRQAAAVPPEIISEMRQMRQQLAKVQQAETQRQQEIARQEQVREYEEVKREVEGFMEKFLTERKYPKDMLPMLAGFVKQRTMELGGGDMEDLPHICNEWYGRMEGLYRDRMGIRVQGAEQARRELPPTVAASAGQPPINGRPNMGANDRTTQAILEAELKARGYQ